jgi:hypothetical protein
MITPITFDNREALLTYLEAADQLSAARKVGVEWLAFFRGGVLLPSHDHLYFLQYPFSTNDLEDAALGR